MKKLLSLATLFVAFSIHAASIDWTITGSPTYVLNDYQNHAYASSTVYLILGSDLSSITYSDENKLTEAQFSSALSALTITTTSSTSAGYKPAVSGQVVTSDKISSGVRTTFGLLVVSTDSDGNGYYKVLTVPGTPYATGASPDAHTTLSTAWNSLGAQQWKQGYAVPEPATGALALAGVALLFRRRRA